MLVAKRVKGNLRAVLEYVPTLIQNGVGEIHVLC